MKRSTRLGLALAMITVASCSGGGPPSGQQSGPELVQGGVIFHYHDTDAKRVYVVGDFNNWSVKTDPLVDENGDGEWTLFYSLEPGIYQYKFVVNDTKWIPDPRNPDAVPDGFDGRNSVIRIPKSLSY